MDDPKFSTPIPKGARKARDGRKGRNAYVVRMGAAVVVIWPDEMNVRRVEDNNALGLTQFASPDRSFFLAGKYLRPMERRVSNVRGKLKATIDFEFDPIVLRLQTFYAPGVKYDDRDFKGAGETIREHEGMHGIKFFEYLRRHPFPSPQKTLA